MLRRVDRDHALAELPLAYAVALRLLERGVRNEDIAYGLGIEPEAVDPLVQLAHVKLAAVMEEQS